MSLVATLSSATEMNQARAISRYKDWATACEVVLVFACILLYIWRWQATHPLVWIPLLSFIIFSQILHHDSPRAVGLTLAELRPSAQVILPLAAAIYVPVLIFALTTHRLAPAWPGENVLGKFAGYGIWCCFQQYLVQCYFHRRLMSMIRTPHLSSLLAAAMFGAAHIPNTVLIAVTSAGGFILAEVYKRYPNIWPLALAQAVGGLLIAALLPGSIIHNMRVGPGYYTYGLR
jgi:Type II CAAX prenyl endopeptidase Rce1-like